MASFSGSSLRPFAKPNVCPRNEPQKLKKMNRKKALLMIAAIEMMLLAVVVALFISDTISIIALIPIVIVIGTISSAATIAAVKKLPIE